MVSFWGARTRKHKYHYFPAFGESSACGLLASDEDTSHKQLSISQEKMCKLCIRAVDGLFEGLMKGDIFVFKHDPDTKHIVVISGDQSKLCMTLDGKRRFCFEREGTDMALIKKVGHKTISSALRRRVDRSDAIDGFDELRRLRKIIRRIDNKESDWIEAS